MDIIDRYVYAVTKQLPDNQKKDIEEELRSIIEEMIEQYEENNTYEKKVQKALLELGDPTFLADNYRGAKRYLIGPENYNNYIMVLKIVFLAIFIGISVSVVVDNIFTYNTNIAKVIAEYMATLFSALLQGFAWVTVSFSVAEYYGVKELNKNKSKKTWDLSQLPQVPVKKAIISRWELAFSIIFSSIFTIIICFEPQLFSAYIPNSTGTTVIPVFNIIGILKFRVLFIVIFILGLSKEVFKFIVGKWTLKLSIVNTVISIVSMILTIIVFLSPEIWNANFISQITNITNIDNLPFKLVNLWTSIKNWILTMIVVVTFIEVVSTLYKGIKYNNLK